MQNTLLKIIFSTVLATLLSLNAYSQIERSTEGEWGAPISFGIVPVAVANLPDGRLLTWSSQFPNTFIEIGDGATFTQLFDPTLNGGLGNVDGAAFTSNTDHDMFCPGINNLPDGRILSAGGTTSERTSIFDPLTGVWSVASEMNIPRGYQGNVTLQDGNVFTVGGSWSGGAGNNGGKDAEVWSPTTGWITLGNITGEDLYTTNDLASEDQGLYRVDNHVWLWPAPNGKLFQAGPGEMMHWIDVDVPGGSIVDAGIRQDIGSNIVDAYSMKGNTVMFDTGKVLKTGGAAVYGDDHIIQVPARDNSFVIDLNNVPFGATPSVTSVGNMAFPRTMHNSTVLPNGEVLITGGLEGAAVFTDQDAVLGAEIFNEGTGWSQVAAMTVPRTYHSVAILMTDGRVFVGGGGLCDSSPGCENHFDAEIYSPPYLFDSSGNPASRPVISSVTGNTLGSGPYNNNPLVAYGDILQVNTDVAVTEFSLIRFSAATHSTNNEQRRIPLTTTTGTSHLLTIPDRNLLPPGYYMLFALDTNGVPSVSRTLRIGTAIPLSTNSNLVLDMRFDETSGINLTDSSTFTNDGVIIQRDNSGVPVAAVDHQFVPGLFGNAIEFDGNEFNSNSLVDIPYDTSFESIANSVTLSAWVWRDVESAVPEAGGKIANVSVLGHDYQDGSAAGGLFFGFHNTLYKWSFRTTTGYYDNYAGYAPLAGWNHVVATYDGTTAKLYANSVLVGEIAASGDLVLNNDTNSELSKFTLSGFYDGRTLPVQTYGNESGITDEVDGKMDNVQVYNTVLGPEEVRNIFNEGLATGNVIANDCETNSISIEYKINNGNWDSNINNRIIATEGDEVFIRALNYTGDYFVTTQIIDGPTFDSTADFNLGNGYQIDTDKPDATNPLGDGFIDIDDRGIYTLTTANGCPSTIFIEVLGSCDAGDTPIMAEYNVNGWATEDEVTISVGDRLQLSVLPNIGDNPEVHPITIILPNGNSVSDGYVIDPISTANAGTYLFISAQGCTDTLEVFVEETDCATLGLETEYRINAESFVTGASSVDINEGNELRLSIIPNGNRFSITSTSTNGNSKTLSYEDLFITNIDFDDAGIYTFTTGGGCVSTLEVNVIGVDCNNLNVQSEYQLNGGAFVSGASQVAVDEGNSITFSILPNNTPYFITSTSVNGNSKPANTLDLTITDLTVDDAGVYTLETNAGCSVEIELIVNTIDCAVLNLQSQYAINNSGTFVSGAQFVRVAIGNTLQLSVVPDTYNGQMLAFEIAGPNSKNLNAQDLIISTIQQSDEGLYTFTSSSGCTTELLVLVGPNDNPVAQGSATPLSGTAPLTVDFVGSTSTDDTGIASYLWEFGDGSTADTADTQYIYTLPGTYTATLTITDNEGATDTLTFEINVTEAPSAIASATPTSGTIPLTVDFIGSTSTDDTGIVSYAWDFGDGTTAATADAQHIYTAVGSFTATLTVTDADGLTDTASITIVVSAMANEAPVAIATATPTSGTLPLTVDFVGDTSTDDTGIVSYAWDFGDGTTAATADAQHIYTAVGSYTATLTVTDSDGLTDTASISIVVSDVDNQAPVAIATATPTSGTIPLTVDFIGSTSTDDTAIVSYAWDFGDGTTAATADAQHIYTTVGSFTATLTVTDADGLTDTVSITIVVRDVDNQAPVAIATATPTSGTIPLTVDFIGSTSTDDTAIVSYAWDFGDGTTAATADAQHIYTTVGSFTATLTVTDADGLTDTASITIVVSDVDNQAPVAIATATPTSGTIPLTVDFIGSTSTDDTAIVSHAWDFGDGTTAATADAQHIYTTVGSFTATLTVTDADGLTDTVSITIVVSDVDNQAPVAIATATPTSGTIPLTVDFIGSTSTDDTAIVSYAWDFGDGTTAATADAQHIYTTVGSFTATLTVTDADGLTDTASITIVVSDVDNQAPVAIATATPTSGTIPLTVDFIGSTSTDDTAIVSYSWDFGDGTTAATADAQHIYTTVGSFTATLTVTDADGLTDTASITIVVSDVDNQAPEASFTADPTTGPAALMVNLDASASSDDKGIASYTWDFGDGTVGIGMNTMHLFNTFGVFEVKLTVTDEEGLSDTDSITITVLENVTLENKQLKDVQVYPNPLSNANGGILTVDLSDFLNERIGISLYDIYGKQVVQKLADKNHDAEVNLDLSIIQQGIYLLELVRIDEDQEYTIKKIIKIE